MQFQKPGRWLACGVAALTILVACGGGDSPFASAPVMVEGTVLDASAQGGRVFLDLNNNQSYDAGEPMSAPVAADGTFHLQVGSLTRAELASAMFVADGGSRAFAPAAAFMHTDLLGRQYASHVVISPLTSLVGAEVAWNNVTTDEAVQIVQRQWAMGSADPFANYVADRDAVLQSLADEAGAGLADLRTRAASEGTLAMMDVAQFTRSASLGGAPALLPQSASIDTDKQRFIVRMRDDATDPGGKGQATAAVHNASVSRVFSRVMKGFAITVPAENAAQFISAMQHDPSVLHVEADRPVKALQVSQPGATWGLDRTDQRYLPLNQTYTYSATGSGVTAYIVDTGIRATHVDLAGRVLAGFSAVSDANGTNDCNGHGTHVSGTVGGTTWGMAKNVALVPVRVLDCTGSGTVSGVIAGLDWVAANATKPAVVNMSLGGSASDVLDAAVANVVSSGITVVVAAGNSSDSACNYSPSRAPAALAVAASTSLDARASFSNFGTCVGVFAPGSSITSASNDSDTATATHSGTSMASPHVAGLAALYLETHGSAAPADVIAAVKYAATIGQISDAGPGSPTTLIYTDLSSASPIPDPPISTPISSPISSPPAPQASLSVGALNGSAAIIKKGWQAKATITAVNQLGALVPGVVVKGVYSSKTASVLSCTTGTNGTCSIASAALPMTLGSVQFTVTGLSKRGGPAYNPALNVKTSISINLPS